MAQQPSRGALAAITGLITEASGSVGGTDHAITVAVIAAIAMVLAAVLGPVVNDRWGSRENRRYIAEIKRKDRRIEELEEELDEVRRR